MPILLIVIQLNNNKIRLGNKRRNGGKVKVNFILGHRWQAVANSQYLIYNIHIANWQMPYSFVKLSFIRRKQRSFALLLRVKINFHPLAFALLAQRSRNINCDGNGSTYHRVVAFG